MVIQTVHIINAYVRDKITVVALMITTTTLQVIVIISIIVVTGQTTLIWI